MDFDLFQFNSKSPLRDVLRAVQKKNYLKFFVMKQKRMDIIYTHA